MLFLAEAIYPILSYTVNTALAHLDDSLVYEYRKPSNEIHTSLNKRVVIGYRTSLILTLRRSGTHSEEDEELLESNLLL